MTSEVSVIIPVFNRRAMVTEAIASVLAQREVRFELIVINDGSTDGTGTAVEQALEDSTRPVRVIETENRGAAAARNLGADAASAPLLLPRFRRSVVARKAGAPACLHARPSGVSHLAMR